MRYLLICFVYSELNAGYSYYNKVENKVWFLLESRGNSKEWFIIYVVDDSL